VRPDTSAAIAFLEKWVPGGPWLLVAIEPDGATEARTFRKTGAMRNWIQFWQGKRNLYFSVNRAKSDLSKKAAKSDISTFDALHVDIDCPADAEPATSKPGLAERVKAYKIPPTVIIDSGNGVQGFWRLAAPSKLNGPESIALFEAYNRQLEKDLDADTCHNLDRIMRLPGTTKPGNA